MSLPDSNEFAPVTSEKDRGHVFEMIGLSQSRFSGPHSELTGFASGPPDPESWTQPFIFALVSRDGESLLLETEAPPVRELRIGEIIEIFFGLEDGKYLLRAALEKVDGRKLNLRAGGELLRLQRRNSFRVTLPFTSRIRFLLTAAGGQTFKQNELSPVDLSAGGMRLRWITPDLPVLKENDEIQGLLTTGGKPMELKAKVRAVLSRNGLTELGFEFIGIAQKDEQALMFLCLQIYRSKNNPS